jgi:MFS family permease
MNRLLLTFQALSTRNFRLYFVAQAISTTGTWTQKVGQAWLVLELSGSGTLLGVTLALQTIPMLVVGPWGGLVADRMDKRRILMATQASAAVLALALAILAATGLVRLWMVLVLAVALGLTHALDKPARNAFVLEMVGPRQLANAIALNSVLTNAGRTIGPALAGFLIAGIGIAASFAVNAATYGAVVVALLVMRTEELEPAPPIGRGPRQLREGVLYVLRTPQLVGPLFLMVVAGTFAYEWMVTIPLLALEVSGGGPDTFGLMFSAMGVGAVVGGLIIAGSIVPSTRSLFVTAVGFSAVVVLTALAPDLPLILVGWSLVGATGIAFRSVGTALTQLESVPEMRGRVSALLTIAFAGTTPIGAPLAGWVGETYGARYAIAMGGLATMLAAGVTASYLRRTRRASTVHGS